MASRRGQVHHPHGRGHGFGHGHRGNGHMMHPELATTPGGPSDGRTGKAHLSYLLNDEDESVLNKTGSAMHEAPTDLGSPMSAPVLSLRDHAWRKQNQDFMQTDRPEPVPSSDASTVTSMMGVSSSNLRLSRNGQSGHGHGARPSTQADSKATHSSQTSHRSGIEETNTHGKGENGTGTEKKGGVRKKRQRKYICDKCNFGFYTNSDLQKHISSVHLQLRPYECSMCDKKFGERSNATKHFKSVHERQRNAACDKCHKVFAFRDGLVRHVRLVHDNVRNFHCQYPGCGQSFKQSAHLKKHEQVHLKGRAGGRSGGAAAGTSGATRGPQGGAAAAGAMPPLMGGGPASARGGSSAHLSAGWSGGGPPAGSGSGSGVLHPRVAGGGASSTRRATPSPGVSGSVARSILPEGVYRVN